MPTEPIHIHTQVPRGTVEGGGVCWRFLCGWMGVCKFYLFGSDNGSDELQ